MILVCYESPTEAGVSPSGEQHSRLAAQLFQEAMPRTVEGDLQPFLLWSMQLLNAVLLLGVLLRVWLCQAEEEALIVSLSIKFETSKTKVVFSDPLRNQTDTKRQFLSIWL